MKKLCFRTVIRGVALIAGFRSVAWFYGVDNEVAAFIAAHRLVATAALAVMLIWIHLVWDADRAKLKLVYDLRTHGLLAVLRAKRPEPANLELPFGRGD